MISVCSRFLAGHAVLALLIVQLADPAPARAHCDTMSGPVIEDGRRALESASPAPVWKWVRAEDEPELAAALNAALAVRTVNDASRELADRYFFETLVRIHRASEGAPYGGLKPATDTQPVLLAADRALVAGSVAGLARDISAAVAAEVQERFDRALELRVHAEENPEAGRRYVAAYVEYVHFVEAVDGLTGGTAAPKPHESGQSPGHQH